MATDGQSFVEWLEGAEIEQTRLNLEQVALLRAAFGFLERCGRDYFSLRILAHFLLHSGVGLKVAQVARLVGVDRSTASRQQKLSSKEVVQATAHRMAGRPYGKLLPRYAGPIAEFLIANPNATRYDVIGFIQRTWDVRVSTVALHNFLKKYGLDRKSRAANSHRQSQTAAVELADRLDSADLPVPLPSEDFFCLHTACRRFSAVAGRP
ncbi:MAG: hypothetical protein V1790_12425 [Planctomycetota bacterium]|jgi:transposase